MTHEYQSVFCEKRKKEFLLEDSTIADGVSNVFLRFFNFHHLAGVMCVKYCSPILDSSNSLCMVLQKQ